jgi:ketosteroid isomerase-like protein
MSGTYGETGKSFSVRGVSVMQLENGKIRRNSDYWNMAEFQRQTAVPAASGG